MYIACIVQTSNDHLFCFLLRCADVRSNVSIRFVSRYTVPWNFTRSSSWTHRVTTKFHRKFIGNSSILCCPTSKFHQLHVVVTLGLVVFPCAAITCVLTLAYGSFHITPYPENSTAAHREHVVRQIKFVDISLKTHWNVIGFMLFYIEISSTACRRHVGARCFPLRSDNVRFNISIGFVSHYCVPWNFNSSSSWARCVTSKMYRKLIESSSEIH